MAIAKIYDDLIDIGETGSENPFARLARITGTQAQIGYRKKQGVWGDKGYTVVDNTLKCQFTVDALDSTRVMGCIYLRTFVLT
ncbi:MAG: hypothetical protein AAF092_17815 [Pseudomonadota bacterium]